MDMATAINLSAKKYFPTVDECKVNNMVKCKEDGCSSVFTSESNLTLHLMKTHRKSWLPETDTRTKQYYCPELKCVYNKNKFLKSMKCLRQHYMKVHSEKTYQCNLCQSKFPTENNLKNHVEYCGVNFECCDCQATYPCYETLKTHGRRKKHHVLSKSEYKSKPVVSSKSDEVLMCQKNRVILPKQCISVIVLPSLKKTTSNQEIQTESGEKPKFRSKVTQVCREAVITPRNTQQTQTGYDVNRLTVETQTIGDFFRFEVEMDQKTSNTQTDSVESKSTSCNTSFSLDDFDISMKQEVERSSSGTQTFQLQCADIYSISTATHDSTHTDTSDLLSNTISDNNFEFFNCNIETQTDFLLDEESFNYDYYMSNMYTQTCDEILNSSVFCDIQTQTALDDVLRSVESQTMVSQGKKMSGSKNMSHMETQTDMGYVNMLEIIHS